ncbi:cell wall hydrolase [Kiloniella laminariae]|uniref:Cell wall hydrolase n=2 Tax=Kiloniella laminariae TaxID=454162 RepID=A0ABT4LDQ2_9PROT|nr:cell wall hydrolase [Kiloniella laminariae]
MRRGLRQIKLSGYRMRGRFRGHWYGLSSFMFAATICAGVLAPESSVTKPAVQVSASDFIAPVDVLVLAREYAVQPELARRRPTEAAVDTELACLAQNIYFEARSETVGGRRAVAHVVLNRVASERFPSTICEVVQQGGAKQSNSCQFSWWCDGRKDEITNQVAWDEAMKLARYVYWGLSKDVSEGALWYHADYVAPKWREAFDEGPTIGRHIFYREKSDDDLEVAALELDD